MKRNDPRRLHRRDSGQDSQQPPKASPTPPPAQTGQNSAGQPKDRQPQAKPAQSDQTSASQPKVGQPKASQPTTGQATVGSPTSQPKSSQAQAVEAPAKPSRVGIMLPLLRILATAAIVATIFTSYTPMGLTSGWGSGIDNIFQPPSDNSNIYFPTPTARPLPKIGIVAGHYGIENDTGATCPDGLSEVSINLEVAARVQQILRAEGYDVDLLKENDARLPMYSAMALVSIHADSCSFDNLEATGFKVAPSVASNQSNKSERLVNCIYSRYQESTGLPYHEGVTEDMTEYHAFEEINPETAAAIIETGFMLLDRQILTQQPDKVAEGIANGILCYIYNEDASPVGGN